jgi:hypothetical protein
VFHFNKKHLEDQTIPMWVLKFHGESYYVNHVSCDIPWTTKETPDNSHTKGSIKIKDCLLTIDDENSATITKLTLVDKFRLRNQKLGITRIIVKEGNDFWKLKEKLQQQNVKHGPFKGIGGACSSTFYITDIMDKAQFTMLSLSMVGTTFRVLMPNEGYYRWYDDPKNIGKDHIWEEDMWDDELDEDDE